MIIIIIIIHDNIYKVMARYSLIEYSDACLKTSGSLWQHDRGKPAIDDNENIIDFPDDNNHGALFNLNKKITRQTVNGNTKDVEIIVPLKNLNNFWRALEMPLINCEISLQWSGNVAMFNVHCSVAMI